MATQTPKTKKLDRKFFNRNTLKVAKELLGKYIVRKIGKKTVVGKIIETEAYMGHDDLASHASRGKTPRTEIMFGASGVAYIYLIYGMYYCFNIVTEKEEFPAAVLIRAVEVQNIKSRIQNLKDASGPGKLCRYFKIDKSLNREDIVDSKKLWLEDRGDKVSQNRIVQKERIGVDYAKYCAFYPWRFYVKDSFFVSKK